MIVALSIALLLLLLLGAVVWFWQRRLHLAARTQFAPVMRPESPRSTQLRVREPEVWRPLPRHHLLQHQRQVSEQRTHHTPATQRLYAQHQRVIMNDLSAAPPKVLKTLSTPVDPNIGIAAPVRVSSRLDRKRQGLDSLITEWSPDSTDHLSEH